MDDVPPPAWPVGDGEMARRIRAHDWAATPLGPAERWPPGLRAAVDLMLAMPGPATIFWGPTGVQLYNDAYLAIARDRHPALLGRTMAQGWPDIGEEANRPLRDAVRAGRATTLTDHVVRLAGSEERAFDAQMLPLRDEAGGVAGVLQTLQDVSERRRRDEALRTSEARFRAFVTASADVVYRMSPDWSEMRRLDGRSFPSDTAEPSRDWRERYVHPDDRPAVDAAIDRAVAARSVLALEHRVVRADGSLGWASSRAVPVLDERGEVVEWLGAASDVTARKEAELARAEAEAALRAHDDRQAFLLALGDALRLRSDAGGKIEAAARLLGERLGASRVLYAEFDEAEGVARIFNGWFADGARPFPTVMRLDEHRGPVMDDLRAGRTVRVDDVVARVDEPAYAAIAAVGVGALLSVPLIVDGGLKVNVSVHQDDPAAGPTTRSRWCATSRSGCGRRWCAPARRRRWRRASRGTARSSSRSTRASASSRCSLTRRASRSTIASSSSIRFSSGRPASPSPLAGACARSRRTLSSSGSTFTAASRSPASPSASSTGPRRSASSTTYTPSASTRRSCAASRCCSATSPIASARRRRCATARSGSAPSPSRSMTCST